MNVVLQLVQTYAEEIEQLVLLRHSERGLPETVDRWEQYRLHRPSTRLLGTVRLKKDYERVQLCAVVRKQQLFYKSVTKPVEPERVRSPRILLLAPLPRKA